MDSEWVLIASEDVYVTLEGHHLTFLNIGLTGLSDLPPKGLTGLQGPHLPQESLTGASVTFEFTLLGITSVKRGVAGYSRVWMASLSSRGVFQGPPGGPAGLQGGLTGLTGWSD